MIGEFRPVDLRGRAFGFGPMGGFKAGGGGGAPVSEDAAARAWVMAARGYRNAEISDITLGFAKFWIDIMNKNSRIEPWMQEGFITSFTALAKELEVDPKHIISFLPTINNVFASHPEDLDDYGRCMVRFADYCIVARDRLQKLRVEYRLATLEVFDDPKLFAIGLRMARIIHAKTRGAMGDIRNYSVSLAINLFNYDAEMFEKAVVRLARTKIDSGEFTASLRALMAIYAGSPERFNEGLDIVDQFVEKLEENECRDLSVDLLHYILLDFVKAYAGYSKEVLEEREITTGDIFNNPDEDIMTTVSTVHTKVKVSANPPEWFKVEMEKLAVKIVELKKRGVDPQRFIEYWKRIDDYIHYYSNSPSPIPQTAIFEAAEKIYNNLIEGRSDHEMETIWAQVREGLYAARSK